MNCKPGDLAVYVGDVEQHRNKVIRVVRFFQWREPAWEIDPPLLPTDDDRMPDVAYDKNLRPINGGETPEQSIEAMKLLHQLPKETV